jgi:lipoic acid synthetase
LGENDDEVIEAMKELRNIGVDMITLGQYLQPSIKHLPVSRFPNPSQFAKYDYEARKMGFSAVASGPLVRSSYRAGLQWEESEGRGRVSTLDKNGSAISNIIYEGQFGN